MWSKNKGKSSGSVKKYSDFWWNLFDSAFFQVNRLLTFHISFFLVLKSEVHDLRIVLQSADKELSAVKLEYRAFREKQEKEMSQLSDRHMDVQFKLDSVRYVGSLVKCLNLPSNASSVCKLALCIS